jgi:hypothetical protein
MDNMASPKMILAAASTNAGAEAIAPAIKKLREQGVPVRVFSHGAATVTFRSMGMEPDCMFEGKPSDATRKIALGIRDSRPRPTSILTGTQMQSMEQPITFEQILWTFGTLEGMKTVAVLDTWANYKERFSDMRLDAPSPAIANPLSRLPNIIAVMDDYAKRQMLELSFPKDVIAVTGNPYFELVLDNFMRLSPMTQHQMLMKPVFANFKDHGETITFMSDSMDGYPDIGFTEKSVLQSFLRIVDDIAAKTGIPINVIVRPHPFRFQDAGSAFEFDTPHIVKVLHNPVTAKGGDPANDYTMEQLLYISDLVVGTFNNPLLTAKIVGNNVVSYMPGLNPKYDFYEFLSAQGLAARVTAEDKLGEVIEAALEGRLMQNTMKTVRGATDAVIKLLE